MVGSMQFVFFFFFFPLSPLKSVAGKGSFVNMRFSPSRADHWCDITDGCGEGNESGDNVTQWTDDEKASNERSRMSLSWIPNLSIRNDMYLDKFNQKSHQLFIFTTARSHGRHYECRKGFET